MTQLLKQKFEKMGARVAFNELTTGAPIRVNVIRDKKGEIFNIETRDDVEVHIPDFKPNEKHLLLMARFLNQERPNDPKQNIKFLCGHDEREWFSSQVDGGIPGTIKDAKLSLIPDQVSNIQNKAGLKLNTKLKRKNPISIRQGEWFFTPANLENINEDLILKKEPLRVSGSVSGSKPHIAEFAYRAGGTFVYVAQLPFSKRQDLSQDQRDELSAGLTEKERKVFFKNHSESKNWSWRPETRNPELYVKGYIRHPDHKTIILPDWHRVYLNTETRGRFNVFLD